MESLNRHDPGPPQHGHQYQQVQVSDSARVHLGDTYNISKLLVEKELKYYEKLTCP
jgi:hypothetical protein